MPFFSESTSAVLNVIFHANDHEQSLPFLPQIAIIRKHDFLALGDIQTKPTDMESLVEKKLFASLPSCLGNQIEMRSVQ